MCILANVFMCAYMSIYIDMCVIYMCVMYIYVYMYKQLCYNTILAESQDAAGDSTAS